MLLYYFTHCQLFFFFAFSPSTFNGIDVNINNLYRLSNAKTDVPEDAAYFHAQFRKTNPLPNKEDYVLTEGIKGMGHYVGTYLAWGVHNNGWWGEGEIKFFMDGDQQFPTICGTGTEDYFCGSYNFDTKKKNVAGVETSEYTAFNTPYAGIHQIIQGDGVYKVMQRFGMYRWHINDPIFLKKT